MAVAGEEARTGDTKCFGATSEFELTAALGAIAGQVATCSFALSKVPPSPDDVAVDIDGARIAQSPVAGWQYNATNTAIVLHGRLHQLREILPGQTKPRPHSVHGHRLQLRNFFTADSFHLKKPQSFPAFWFDPRKHEVQRTKLIRLHQILVGRALFGEWCFAAVVVAAENQAPPPSVAAVVAHHIVANSVELGRWMLTVEMIKLPVDH